MANEDPVKAAEKRRIMWGGAGLFLLVLIAYVPVCWAGFVWDDDLVLTANPCVVGPLGFPEIWTTGQADICPLTISTFWLEHLAFGLHPLPYHIFNVVLHGLAAVTLWRVLARLRLPGAWIGAALWALHPVQAESVAWITEMKNTESGLFFLLSLLLYLRWIRITFDQRLHFAAFIAFGALAMAAKSSTVVLPVVMLLCAWWKDRLTKEVGVATIPLFVIGLITGAISIWTQFLQTLVAHDALPVRSFAEQLCGAGAAVWFYLGKLIWPWPQMAVYPPPGAGAGTFPGWLPLLGVIAAFVILLRARAGWGRAPLFAFACFVIALAPALGLVGNFIFQFSPVFDHFQYLASMAPLAFLGAALAKLSTLGKKPVVAAGPAVAGVILIALGSLTWLRASVYQDSLTLWTDAVEKNPDSWVAHANLGQALTAKGDVPGAVRNYVQALVINTNSPETLFNYGNAMLSQKQTTPEELQQAIVAFTGAVNLYPGFYDAHCSLGWSLTLANRFDEAEQQYLTAIDMDHGRYEAYNGLGTTRARKGDMNGAVTQFQAAVKLAPDLSEVHNNLGAALYGLKRYAEAEPEFAEAFRLDPTNDSAHGNLNKVREKLHPADAPSVPVSP